MAVDEMAGSGRLTRVGEAGAVLVGVGRRAKPIRKSTSAEPEQAASFCLVAGPRVLERVRLSAGRPARLVVGPGPMACIP